jgi:hypothetical protein
MYSAAQESPVTPPAAPAPLKENAPPAGTPGTKPKKRIGGLIKVLVILAAFIVGIGFEKFKVVARIASVTLPTITISYPSKHTPTPRLTPAPTASPTAHWKTFASTDMTFQYPPKWELKGNRIATDSPNITLTIVPKDGEIMNECMQLVGTTSAPGYVVKKFIRIITGEACATGDPTPREIWVVPTQSSFSPGISFSYVATEATEAGKIFTQLVSTFKFTQNSATGSAQYTCPLNGYVDCMPVLTPEKQAACSTEAMAWYKINCPNFKGGAM